MIRSTALMLRGVGVVVLAMSCLALWCAGDAWAQAKGENPFGGDVPSEQAGDDPFGATKEGTPKQGAAESRRQPARPSDNLEEQLDAKIRATLLQPTKIDFVETPLQDAVAYLMDYHGIAIQLDVNALEDIGVGADSPVSRHFDGTPLDSSLKLLLGDLGLTYLVRGGVLLVTTPDQATLNVETRVYDVEALLGEETSPGELAKLLEALAGTSGCKDQSIDRLTIVPFRNLLVVRASWQDHEEVMALIGTIKGKLRAD